MGETRAVNDRDFLPAATAAIGAATDRIRVAEYLLYDDPSVLQLVQALEGASRRGVQVQVLADETGDETADLLDRMAGWDIETRLDSRDVTLHAKLIVADDVSVIGSHNFTGAALDSNHEGSVLVVDPEVSDWYARWFDAVWTEPDAVPAIEPLARTDLAPVSDRDVVDALVDCIDGAVTQVDVVLYAASWNDAYPGSEVDRVLTALEDAHTRGVQVTPMLDQSAWIEDNAINDDAIARLQAAGIDILRTPASTTTHAKVTRCDDTVIVSDANWSYSGLYLMRGTSIVLREASLVDEYAAWIEAIRAESAP